jgi:hypothetical protein
MTDRIQVADAFKHLEVKSGAEGILSGFTRIAHKGKVWAVVFQGQRHVFVRSDDGTNLPYLDVVIVGVNDAISKMYYPAGTYTDEATNPPTCASLDGITPDRGVPIQQSPSCGTCKRNEWLPNRKGKECQDHKRVAVILLPYMKTRPALPAPLLDPVFLKIPPASLKSWKGYCDDLVYQGVPYESVITRITFDPEELFQMNFGLHKPLTNAEAPLVLPLLNSPQTRNLIGTMPEIREVKTPDLPQEDTGLVAAFGSQQGGQVMPMAPAKRGRPRKPVEEIAQQPVQQAQPAKQQEAPAGDETPSWERTDEEVDNSLQNLLSTKVGDMLK